MTAEVIPIDAATTDYARYMGRRNRTMLVRAVLAMQWAVAVRLCFALDDANACYMTPACVYGWATAADCLGSLPCADAVVADLLGEVRDVE